MFIWGVCIIVVATEPDFDSGQSMLSGEPLSPISSYDKSTTTDFPNDVPLLPPQLGRYITQHTTSGKDSQLEEFGGASHVRLDHLYTHRAEDNVRCLSLITRYHEKMINTIFVTSSDVDNPDSLTSVTVGLPSLSVNSAPRKH